MERSEPTFVPEWLRSTGSSTGSGSSTHHFSSSSSHSDAPSLAHQIRNRTSKNIGDFDAPRSAFLDRTSSSNSRRGSSNGSSKHAYSSFNRGHREKDREKEKERLSISDSWDRDSSDPLGNMFSSRSEKDILRRSNSMVSRKQGELFPRRVIAESKSNFSSTHNNGNGVLPGSSIVSSIQKAVFDKDFPSLGTEDKQGPQDIGRVSSPGLSTAAQSLPFSNAIGGEGWTSALAEVPTIIGGSATNTGSSSVQQTGPNNSCTATGLNMAEALAQAPSRARSAPHATEVSIKTQRLEELAIKQSRQLIPVTPSMPKASVLTSDKLKPKTPSRTSELNVAVKSGQQQLSLVHHANYPLRGGHVKSDASKASHGKFLVLKPVRENGVSLTPKDTSSPTGNANSTAAAANSHLAVAPSIASAPLRSPNNLNSSSMEHKIASVDLKSGSNLEKRLPSLVQSRNDFFNLIKKKTSMSVCTAFRDSCPSNPSPMLEKPDEVTGVVDSPASSIIENGAEVSSNGDNSEDGHRFSDIGEKNAIPITAVDPDEEEAAFLRSLGWEENAGDDEGLTEEEISAFYQEYMKLKPSLKVCRGLPVLPESQCTSVGGSHSQLSSGSESEA